MDILCNIFREYSALRSAGFALGVADGSVVGEAVGGAVGSAVRRRRAGRFADFAELSAYNYIFGRHSKSIVVSSVFSTTLPLSTLTELTKYPSSGDAIIFTVSPSLAVGTLSEKVTLFNPIFRSISPSIIS